MRFISLCSLLALAGCTETTAACPDDSHVRYADGSCGPLDAGGASGVDGGEVTPDGGSDDAGEVDECGGCPSDLTCRPDGMCVECVAAENCTGGEVCDITPGDCVECVDNTTCPAERPTCDTNTCVAMCDRALCTERFAGTTPACNSDTGACVGCDRRMEGEDCGGTSCHPETRSCTTTAVRSVGMCEPCVSDSECAPLDLPGTATVETITQRCVPTDWRPMGAPGSMPAGSYCLPAFADAMLDDCPSGLPRIGNLSSAAIMPMEAFYCLPDALTTCPALLDTGPCTPDTAAESCGMVGEPDAACVSARCRAFCDPAEPLGCPGGDACSLLPSGRHACI